MPFMFGVLVSKAVVVSSILIILIFQSLFALTNERYDKITSYFVYFLEIKKMPSS